MRDISRVDLAGEESLQVDVEAHRISDEIGSNNWRFVPGKASVLRLPVFGKPVHAVNTQYPVCIRSLIVNPDTIALAVEVGDFAGS